MKKYSWVLLILYFGLFVVFGLIFYFKYLDRFLKSGAEPQPVETPESADYIYYSESNNLFRLRPELQLDPTNPERVERFQSTGVVNYVDINKTGNLLAYEVKTSQGLREIWQVDTATNESAKIAFQGKEGLADFQEFSRPKFSPDSRRLAFIGLGSIDQIIIYDFTRETLTPVTKQFALKFTDFTWEDSQKIIFCTRNLLPNLCYEVDLVDNAERKILEADASQLAMSQSGLIYLAKDQDSANLYLLDLNTLQSSSISDLKAPKKVNRFSLDKNAQKIVYEVADGNFSDIYFARTDGSNKIQLTIDGGSTMAILNPNGEEVAFQKIFDGIYSIKLDQYDQKKIVNMPGKQVNMLLWR